MSDLVTAILNLAKGSSAVATPVNGGTIAGYRNVDLSGFTPGGSAPVLDNVSPLNMAGTGAPSDSSFWGSMLGNSKTGEVGWGGLALGAAQGIGNAWMGMKQYGLAQDMFKENKRQYNQNYAAQKSMTNSRLSDRQHARVASNPGAYQSEAEYMNQYRIK